MPEKFLILGLSSFYGGNFASYALGRGDQVVAPPHDWRIGDDLPHDDFDYVVNFASRSLVAESWLDPQGWLMTNAVFTTALLDSLRERVFKKFIHVSTPESYGHTEGWVDENYTAWKPSSPYGVSRAAADMMLMAYHRAYGFQAIITRTANIYGNGQGANRIIPLAFETIGAGKKLDLHGGGHALRCFIHVSDACAALHKIAKDGSVGQTYHISTTREISIANLVKMICKRLGKRPEDHIGTQNDRLGKDHAYLLKSERIRHMGWRDTISLEKGLEEYGARTRSAGEVPSR